MTTKEATSQITDMTVEEAVSSLNGFDEVAIEKKFKYDLEALQEKPLWLMRAVAYVIHRRGGLTDDAAYEKAMSHCLGDLQHGMFAPDEDPDEERSESGKDSTSPD